MPFKIPFFKPKKRETKPLKYSLHLYDNNDYKIDASGEISRSFLTQTVKKTSRFFPQAELIPEKGWKVIKSREDLIRAIEPALLKNILPQIAKKVQKNYKKTFVFVSGHIDKLELIETEDEDTLKYNITITGVWNA